MLEHVRTSYGCYYGRAFMLAAVFFLLTVQGLDAASITFDGLTAEAFTLATRPYNPAVAVSIVELDPPADGLATSVGLVFGEYDAIDTELSFFDDGVWWFKTRPRGNVHRDQLRVFLYDNALEDYREIGYALSDYDYTSPAIVPSLPNPIPVAGQYIPAIHVGHRVGTASDWPQVLYLGGEGYGRLAGFPPAEFGSSFRFGVHKVGAPNEDFPKLLRIYLTRKNAGTFEYMGLIDSAGYTAALKGTIVPGKKSNFSATVKLFLRHDYDPELEPETGPFGVSSMFWKDEHATPGNTSDEAHDADTIIVKYSGGSTVKQAITIPTGPSDPPLTTDYVRSGTTIASFILKQADRNQAHYSDYSFAGYQDRVSYDVRIVSCSVPYTVRLYRGFTNYEGADNVVAYVAFTTGFPHPVTVKDAITFSYRLKAFR
jgi:glucan biosynthesis protein